MVVLVPLERPQYASLPHRGRTRTQIPCRCRGRAVESLSDSTEAISQSLTIVIVGGTGRVGSSTAAALLEEIPSANIVLSSRRKSSWESSLAARRPDLKEACRFREVDVRDPRSILEALKGADLVIHTAGPFQEQHDCSVLEAAIATGTPYMDVCDDTTYSKRAKSYSEKAKNAGIPAITSAGIYPGVSNVMAAHMVSLAAKEYDASGRSYVADPPDDVPRPRRILYSYFTAGTGGAGPTILKTSFLLAGEDVVAYKDGNPIVLPPVSNRRVVDFGPGLGRRSLFLYSLPEVSSGREVFRVPNISARFGTSPQIFNWAMWLTARVVPKGILRNRDAIENIVRVLDPVVRPFDNLVGEKVGMLVEVETDDDKVACGLFLHPKLSESVGICNAAFARCILAGHTTPGVHYPEEKAALKDRLSFLAMASKGTSKFLINKPLWAIETEAKQLGMGMYL